MTRFFKYLNGAFLLLVLLPVFTVHAQRYQEGDVVDDFSIIDRATGNSVNLYDLEGKIIFLEWFAWWCPFCQAAASQVEPGIVDYYKSRGGNANGVEFVHVAINLQGSSETSTQAFIDAYNLGMVWNDFDRSIANRFQSGGQPIFAIINGVKGSPSHDQWELVYSRLGYGDLSAPIATFRAEIDSVQAGVVIENDAPPFVVEHPVSQTLDTGNAASFSVTVENSIDAVYQWFKDGVALSGANAATLTFESIDENDAGDYTVQVATSLGSVTSRLARLLVDSPVEGEIVNMSVRSLTGVGGEPLIMGFVVGGGEKAILARGIGPTLSVQGVSNPLANPNAILVESLPDAFVQNDNWQTDYPDANSGVFLEVGAFELPDGSLDSAIVDTVAGARTVVISDVDAGEGIALAELYDLGEGSGELINVSARNAVGEGENVLIVGFAISGNTPKQLLVRGVGPKLLEQGVSGVLQDPQLALVTTVGGSAAVIATNDDWEQEARSEQASALVPGAFALDAGSSDAVILMTVPAGVYTVILSGVNGGAGVGLLEVYLVQ